ncbi:hypothetical protein E6O75_ATG07300 [Venturia nashicola]|uniref:Uncharacterized protein n=1 Tax=Venturia nashicola TaxID=86259 RepID=A0A4Z1NT31_9PEZI|nr:hypothetical protein E6O75_ATG07300 [Venturia nashicola]
MQTTDSSVSSLIITFTRSLDYFKNLREERKKKKTLKVNKKKEALRGDELRLSMSLRQGPVEIQREYERNYRANGDQYAVGDAIASASLAQAIRRLNAGLLSIISSFLGCGQKKKTQLDYKYLTSVSELSRHEALDALSQLNARMSRSALSLHDERRRCTHPTEKGRCVRGCQRKLTSPDSKASLKVTANKLPKQLSRDTKEPRAPEVRRIQLRDSSGPELAMVRPRARRTKSSTSVSSKGSSTPPPAYSPPSTPGFSHHSHAPSVIPNPYTWAPLSPGKRRQTPDHEGLIVHPPYPLSPLPPCTEHPEENSEFVPYSPVPAMQRRRADKLTPSMYTTVSKASTNLGEIPMSQWNRPWDAEEMDRKNEEMRDRTWARDTELENGQRKRGWWRLFSGGKGPS